MAWIESHQSLKDHRKTKEFKRMLGIKLPQAIGHLHLLWWWALDNAPDGYLTGINFTDIAKVVEDKDEEGQVIGAHVVTTVKFETNCEPGNFDKLLLAVANEHPVNAMFDSPQLALNIPETEK